jgi:hypothetical protein
LRRGGASTLVFFALMATPLTLQTTVSDITFYLSSTDSSKDEPLLTYIKSGTTSRSPILDTDLEPKFLNGIGILKIN